MTKTRNNLHTVISLTGGTVLVNVTLSLAYLRNTVDGSIVSFKNGDALHRFLLGLPYDCILG